MNSATLIVEKKIRASRERLFRAWITERDFARWFISGDGVSIESVSLDARPGGRFSIVMQLDGQSLPHEGEYLVIDEPEKLVFTWRSHMTAGESTLVTVLFQALERDASGAAQTLITLTHEKLAEPVIEAHRGGWTSILVGLATYHGDE